MLAANAALTAAVVYLSKDIKVQGDGTLQTDNGDAMTAGKKHDIPLFIHDATRRRLRMLDGKRRLEVMQVPEWACNAAKTFGVRTHDFDANLGPCPPSSARALENRPCTPNPVCALAVLLQ